MAFGRLERTARPTPVSDINMTPLIDVMLVLLVIFMITAPLMTARLNLELPKVEGTSPSDQPATLTVAMDAAGTLFVDERATTPEDFRALVAQAARRNPDTEVQLRADQAVPYGRVAEVIGTVQAVGLNRIGFVAQPAAPAASR